LSDHAATRLEAALRDTEALATAAEVRLRAGRALNFGTPRGPQQIW
jgi:hypothetical protein